MADYHQIVEQIRTALHSGDPGHNGRLAGLASAYADACAEAAQRLGRCHRLLQQGLRSEAIQLAESEPKLLDTLAILDFPERPEWDDVVQLRNLTAAPRIPLEPARLLNEAYADEDPLQELMRRHRRLALQRAPLKLRIAVLRQLAAQDPSSPVWAEDLRTFEQARMLEIQAEAAEAIRHHDAEAIQRLVSELEQSGWIEMPPKPLVLSLRKADSQIKRELARTALEDVAARLDEAIHARDPIRGRLARHEWSRLASAAALPHDDPIAGSGPACPRLARRAGPPGPREPRARGRPRRPGPRPRLSGIDRAGRPRAAGPRRAGSWRRPPGSTPPAPHLPPPRRRGGADAPQADHLGRIRRGRDPRRQLDLPRRPVPGPRPPGRPGRHRDRRHARARRARPRRHRGQEPRGVRPGPPQVSRAGRGPRARGDRTREGVGTRGEVRPGDARGPGGAPSAKPPAALETARSLARLETEKTALENLVRTRTAALQSEEGRREKELTPRLDEVARSVDRLEQQLKAPGPGQPDDPALLGSIADTRRALADMASDVAITGAGVQDRVRNLSQRLDAVESGLDRRNRQARLEDAITAAVAYSPDGRAFTDSAALAKRLQAFIKAFPDSPRSRAFTTTLHDQPVWDAIGEWDHLTAGWRDGRAAVAPQEAAVRAEQCRQFVVQHPTSPDSERASAYRHAMEAMAHRAVEGEGALGQLQKLMTDLLVDNLWMVTVRPPASSGPKHYYATQQPARGARSIRYLVGFDGKEKTLQVVGDWVEKTDVSPQTKLAGKFKPMLFKDPTQIDWEVVMLDLIDHVRTEPGMDPVLRVALLRKVLELAMAGSEPLQAALGGLKNQVDQADVDANVPWMDPDNREAEHMRPKASSFLRSLPDLTAMRKDAMARTAAVNRTMTGRPQSVGWLASEPDGWRVRTGAVLPAQGTLFIVVAGEDGHGAWKKIGVIDQSRPRLTIGDDPALAEGRPVFVVPADAGG